VTESHDDLPTLGSDEPLDELSRRAGAPDSDERPIIPNYEILRLLGRGGMGEVWEAEQVEPVQRRVAIKVIRSGLDRGQFIARFEAERQALALMDHPGIARIFDAGSSERGVPYFVMEFVEGVPFVEYCDRNSLGVEERLRLFMKVCEGVNHAHQKGIIHRDLKPGNVLVSRLDGQNVPKVIDFGVAKATDERAADRTMVTRAGALIGTLEYMSPEQLEGSEDIDTRSDVYALGVMLYEILARRLPFASQEHENATLMEMWRILREEEPRKPSLRVEESESTDGRERPGTRSLRRRLRGDLDWITMKALERDRSRRYDTPGELAADIRRHLESEPVSAGPPTTMYRLGKFARRHRVGVAAAALVLVAIVVGMAGTTYGLLRARRAETEVRKEAAKATAVNEFLHGMLASANPNQSQGREVTVRELLSAASSEVGGGEGPEALGVEAAVRNTIGATYQALGLYQEAEPHLKTALEERRALHLGDDVEVAESLQSLGRLRWAMSDYVEAERLIQEALAMGRRLPGNRHEFVASCLGDLAVVLQGQGNYVSAEPMIRESLELSRSLYGEVSEAVADHLNNLAWAVHYQGRTAEAEELFRQSLAVNEELFGADHPRVLVSQLNLASILEYEGKGDEAESTYLDTSARLATVLGPEHPTTLSSRQSLAELYLKSGRPAQARPILEEAQAIAERTLGADHGLTITLLADLGWVHRVREEWEEADRYYRETLDRRVRSLGEENPHTIRSRWQLARILVDRGRYAEAESAARAALETGRRVLPDGNENLLSAELFLGLALLGLDRPADAEPLLRECLTGREATLPEGSWELAHARGALGSALADQGRFAEAEPLLLGAVEDMRADPNTPPVRLRNAVTSVARLYERWKQSERGRSADAARWRTEVSRLK
jgi:serine/threonine protein kinase/tetratricopeptide (TPR) repeat protein